MVLLVVAFFIIQFAAINGCAWGYEIDGIANYWTVSWYDIK